MQYVVIFLIFIILLAIFMAILPYLIFAIIVVTVIYLTYKIVRKIKKNRYFSSEEFLNHKNKVRKIVEEYNEIAEYIESIPNNNYFVPKEKEDYSHLARYENTSEHNYVRDRNTRTMGSNVYDSSLQIVKKAKEEPIKYLCKYFDIDFSEESLVQLEDIGQQISRMENTLENLENRQLVVEEEFNPPKFILKYYKEELMRQIGMDVHKLKIRYAKYKFEYVGAGGNSSQTTTIDFNSEMVEAVIGYVDTKIKYKKSAKGQRALMTQKLRNYIKERDNYTCKLCSASIYDQNLLLLEVDHKIPISKGGLSTEDNLQTLCWKCNRSKSDKIL